MDFLALTALTVISDCLLSIKQSLEVEINWPDIALNDERAMAVFAEGRTDAVFQFESSGMQEICRKLKPKSIEDLAALNALYRPGPLDGGMVDDFIQRHHGKKSVRYLVPEMKEILSNTYGIMVYQEQIMQLAQKLAGYTLAEADLMRRAMGKKKREEMAVHQEKFVKGAVERGIKQEKADKIFSLMAQFSDYGFNRSHSVAYAYLAFQTAYLKAHYAEHFYAAVLSSESQDAAKVFKYSKELRSQGILLLPPDVNESMAGFTPLKGEIRYGLAAIKGLGDSTVKAIIAARMAGSFRSLFDFAERIEQGSINKRAFESLISGGAFDSLKPESRPSTEWRVQLHAAVDTALARAQRSRKARLQGQDGLFGSDSSDASDLDQLPAVTTAWTRTQLLVAEKNALGFFITGHPLEDYIDLLREMNAVRSADLQNLVQGSRVSIGGIVSDFQARTTKKGDRFALFRLEDDSGATKCVAWPEAYRRHSALLQPELPALVTGRLELADDNPPTIIVDQVQRLDGILANKANSVLIRVSSTEQKEMLFERILEVLHKHPGADEVVLEMILEPDVQVRIRANTQLRVRHCQALVSDLKQLGCLAETSDRLSFAK
jgi:DNA polymerase-3 subunit alpha